ncbi:MAG: hypothetical protein IPQ07_36005 [Myxococcales bacterium]|nr:hypothetical protein [Myxococcales bacterium]
MMNSRSNRWLLILGLLAGWLVLPASAIAGRKRVVVLELEGPKADKFHADLVKLIKKTHTVIPIDKWNGTAEELDAGGGSDKDLKKIAKKLKIDAIIQGKVEKRRENYILQLKVHAGKSGAMVGGRIDVKAEGPRIDGQTTTDLKDELIPAIDGIASNRGGGGDDEGEDEEKPTKKKKDVKEDEGEDEEKPTKKGFGKKKDSNVDEGEDEEKPTKKGFGKKKDVKEDEGEDEEKPTKKGFGKKDDEETNALRTKKDEKKPVVKKDEGGDEEDSPLPKPKKVVKKDEGEDEEGDGEKKPKKKVARKDDGEEEEEGVEASGDEGDGPLATSPGERAIDGVVGLSFNARRMAFTYSADLGNNPKPYKGVPVAGILVDVTMYPLAISHKRHDMLKNVGLTFMYDKVLKIQSKQGTVTLPTAQARFALGAAFRYPLGSKAVVGGTLRLGRQNFTIGTSNGVSSDLPNVNYTILDPGAFLRFAITPKITFNLNVGFMAFLGTGAIQKNDSYGAATVTGFEGEIGGDYLLTKNIFARAAFKFETIGFSFKGTGTMTTGRDTDTDQDVFGARDNYLGGAVTVGYLY